MPTGEQLGPAARAPPTPSDFTSFLGDVAMWTGITTASLMLASPLLFERLGWRGVASATPQVRFLPKPLPVLAVSQSGL